MILCSCNRITDRDIKQAQLAGAQTPKQVYQYVGLKPNCGSCIQSIREELDLNLSDKHFALARSA